MSEGKLDVNYEIVSSKGSKNAGLVMMYSSEPLSRSFKVSFERCPCFFSMFRASFKTVV